MRAHIPRAVLRTRCYLAGRIAYASRAISLNCVVRNLSSQGALLIVPDAQPLPRAFELDIRQRESFHAHLIWRRGNVCGVQFVGHRPAEPFEPTYCDRAPVGL